MRIHLNLLGSGKSLWVWNPGTVISRPDPARSNPETPEVDSPAPGRVTIGNTTKHCKWWDFNGINRLPPGSGFLPSTVVCVHRSIIRTCSFRQIELWPWKNGSGCPFCRYVQRSGANMSQLPSYSWQCLVQLIRQRMVCLTVYRSLFPDLKAVHVLGSYPTYYSLLDPIFF